MVLFRDQDSRPWQLTFDWVAVPRSIREALVSWDRQLYEVPLMSEQPEPGTIYERVYDLGGEDAYIADHTIDGIVFIPVRQSCPS